MNQPDFWQDQNRAKIISQECENLRSELNRWQQLKSEVDDLFVLASSSNDDNLEAELVSEVNKLKNEFEQLELAVFFSAPHDTNNAILTIHSGSGGVEAQDWAEMLLRMYLRYCERKNFTATIIDESRGNEAGIKNVTLEIKGYRAFGYLKSEAGVHRLVRISPFDAEKMRHTSFALVEVIPEIDDNDQVDLKDEDLKIETMRAGGHGGQSVNTTDSAVRITHLPTGIVVKCQNERSQVQNRQMAIKHLKSKLAKLQEEQRLAEIQKIRGEVLLAEWGNQIRSYVLQPYKLVKDHRTDFSSPDPDSVLDGQIDEFVESYLKYINQK